MGANDIPTTEKALAKKQPKRKQRPEGEAAQPSGEAAVGIPITYAEGPRVDHGISVDQAMFFPAEEREPRYIGATKGHSPILMHCGACEYEGWSSTRPTRGTLHLMGGIATLGLVFLTPFLKDTGHYCPKCGRKVAAAKLM